MRRKSVITAAVIAGVALAASAAIAANIGILSAADDSEIGSLSATGDLAPADTQVVDVYVDDSATTTTPASTGQTAEGLEFAVDAAGTVTVIETADGVRLGDVVSNPGWTWSLAQTDASALTVSFTDGTRMLEFSASVGPDGEITAAVNEPIVAAVANGSYDGHGADGDDDEHEHDEHEEHEGADDDD
jgi:hypothetical protein